ncbi:MAG TPA: phospholipase D-like domain-containing protein [Bacilli bacterium]
MVRNKIIIVGAVMLMTVLIVAGVVYAVQLTRLPSNTIEWAFTQEDQAPEKLLINVIHSAQTSLDVAIFSLTHPDIVQAIKEVHKRGVEVRLMTDKEEAVSKAQSKALNVLRSAGVSIKINKHKGLMHLKSVIVDREVVTTGSFNFSKSASTENDEILIVHRNEGFAAAFSATFERMWNDEAKFETLESSSF